MITKTFTYTDYLGVERTEKAMFNLSKSELMKLELGTEGGWKTMVEDAVAKKDIPVIMDIFEDLIRRSYGVVSPDGRRLIKNAEQTEAFMQTEAYDQFYMDLLTDTDLALKFFEGVIPKVDAPEAATPNAISVVE